MIKQEIIEKNHILIKCNEPIRIEIIETETGFLVYGYKGIRINQLQEPILVYETED